MPRLQNLIHELDAGIGKRYLWYGIMAVALVLLVINYNNSGFKNLSNPEAMDAAQLAHNLAEGQGFHTRFIRPFSIYLAQKASGKDLISASEPGQLNETNSFSPAKSGLTSEIFPDISNPPVYPLVLAGMMKVFPAMSYQVAGPDANSVNIASVHYDLWNNSGHFWIYGPDFWISLFNQLIFLGTTCLLFFFARQLFDPLVALVSVVIFLGTDLFWRFSISGLSTMLLMLIFLTLARCLAWFETESGDEKPAFRQLMIAALAGLLTGIGCLTRYSFGWLIFPVGIFLFLFSGNRRIPATLAALTGFIIVVVPWTIRNYFLSHAFFGTAGYSTYALTYLFPEYRLERSINPDFGPMRGILVWYKFLTNIQLIFQEDLPRLSGSLVGAFFLVGLLIRFQKALLNRLRIFLLLSLATLMAAQALSRTQLSLDSPVVNSENLLVLLSPLVIVFGVSLFLSLLDQITLPIPAMRPFCIATFCAVLCLPVISAYFGSRSFPIVYPYNPPVIQTTANWMRQEELTMSDIPWAVAWYGRHQCVWLTDNATTDFADVNQRFEPVKAIYLTQVTMDAKFLSESAWAGESSWGTLALNIMFKRELPAKFPLTHITTDYLPAQVFITDSKRWTKKVPAEASAR